MPWLIELATSHWLVFALVLARVSGLVVTAPLFTALEVPARMRALLALALAVLIVPTQLAATPVGVTTWVDLVGFAGRELLLGMALGLGVAIVLGAAQLAGQMIAQSSGLSLADVFDPVTQTALPVFSRFLHLVAVAIYLTIGGHRWLMAGLLDSFSRLPLGSEAPLERLAEVLLALVAESFSLGIRAAAPVTLALLLATVSLALVARTVPQLNALALGFGLNSLVTFGALAVSLGAFALLFGDAIEPATLLLLDALSGAAIPGPFRLSHG